jgi:hypothetical protein
VHRPQLAAAVVQMALALQGKHAHLMMAAKAAALPRDGAAVPAAPTDVPLDLPRGASAKPVPDNVKAATHGLSWPVRLRRLIGLGRRRR